MPYRRKQRRVPAGKIQTGPGKQESPPAVNFRRAGPFMSMEIMTRTEPENKGVVRSHQIVIASRCRAAAGRHPEPQCGVAIIVPLSSRAASRPAAIRLEGSSRGAQRRGDLSVRSTGKSHQANCLQLKIGAGDSFPQVFRRPWEKHLRHQHVSDSPLLSPV